MLCREILAIVVAILIRLSAVMSSATKYKYLGEYRSTKSPLFTAQTSNSHGFHNTTAVLTGKRNDRHSHGRE